MKTILHSFSELPKTPEMAEQQIAITLFRWALAPEYRAVPTRSGQIVHRRFEFHTLAELETKVDAFGPRLAAKVKAMPCYKGIVQYLCPDEHRPGVPIAA
jgi:hypothetical protein